jgi:hypothetical protein
MNGLILNLKIAVVDHKIKKGGLLTNKSMIIENVKGEVGILV